MTDTNPRDFPFKDCHFELESLIAAFVDGIPINDTAQSKRLEAPLLS